MVLEYRAARQAVELFNAGSKGIETLQQNPGLINLLLEMHRAQGTETDEAAILADMAQRGSDDGDG